MFLSAANSVLHSTENNTLSGMKRATIVFRCASSNDQCGEAAGAPWPDTLLGLITNTANGFPPLRIKTDRRRRTIREATSSSGVRKVPRITRVLKGRLGQNGKGRRRERNRTTRMPKEKERERTEKDQGRTRRGTTFRFVF